MKRLAFAMSLVACGCGKAKKPNESTSSGSAIAPGSGSTAIAAGSGSTTTPSVGSGSAAPVDAQSVPVELRVGTDAVGPIKLKMEVDRERLAALVPGYTVVEESDYFEGEPYPLYEVKQGEARILRVLPVGGKVSSIIVFAALPNESDVKVGMAFTAASEKLGSLDCQVEYHDDPLFANDITCGAGTWSLVFENHTKLGEGKPVAAKLMTKSTLTAIVIR